jgi:hypothetical protein
LNVGTKKKKLNEAIIGRQPNEHEKHITGLDLFSVDSNGNANYVGNVWKGSYSLNTQASIPDTIPQDTSAGLYYYRVWVTNTINGQHGPDCLETSHTFKVTSGSHVNAAGVREFVEHLDDANIYNNEHFDGCFGLTVDYPQEGATFKNSGHVQVTVNRDSASQTGALTKVELYKGDQLVDVAWQGSEAFQNAFTLKDHLSVNNVDTSANYHYKLYTSAKKSQGKTCTFVSKNFKISN